MLSTQSLTREEHDVLAKLPFFTMLDADEMQDVASSVRKRSYRRGEIIHHVDDIAGDVFVVTRGHVKHRITAFDGRQLTHSVDGPGGFFGMLSVIDQKRRAGDAVGLTDCEVLVIDRDVIVRVLRDHREANAILLRHHVRSLREKLSLVHDLAFLSVPMRLAKAILEYAEPGTEPASPPAIPGYLNQTELAFLVSSTRESVNQCLKTFARHGWIDFDRRTIRITDPEGLRKAHGL
jgi:CRP-like cAMP-binding protein